jgi:hypothetical protein
MNPHRFGAAVPRTCLSAANHSFALHALKNLLEARDSRWARLAGFGSGRFFRRIATIT